MHILVLSRYDELGASSRLRFYQYFPLLESEGIEITVSPLFDRKYVSNLYSGKRSLVRVVLSYARRMLCLVNSRKFDVIFLEKEVFPWLPSWFEISLLPKNVSIVVDYDDAIHHKYDKNRSGLIRLILGKKIDSIMRRCGLVICGNDYLVTHAKQIGAARVELLPTVVDVSRYKVEASYFNSRITIGWIGSPITAEYLKPLRPVLDHLVDVFNVRIVAIGANPEQLIGLPVESVKWSENSEVTEICKFDIGIMPLPDEPFERGKCGYKLIQYMACGKPVVASPVGANNNIVKVGINGFLASSTEEWKEYLGRLCSDPELRIRMGSAGRNSIEIFYSLNLTAQRLVHLLKSSTE